MTKLKGIINKLSVLLSRYRDERFTGKVTVVFSFFHGDIVETRTRSDDELPELP